MIAETYSKNPAPLMRSQPRWNRHSNLIGMVTAVSFMLFATIPLAETKADEDRETTKLEKTMARQIAGFIEDVWLGSEKTKFEASLETGMDVSMIRVKKKLVLRKRRKAVWAEFYLTNKENKRVKIDAPISSFIKMTLPGAKKSTTIPVVKMSICFNGKTEEAQFMLWHRPGMKFSLVLGRRFLAKRYLVDPEKNHIATKYCGDPV